MTRLLQPSVLPLTTAADRVVDDLMTAWSHERHALIETQLMLSRCRDQLARLLRGDGLSASQRRQVAGLLRSIDALDDAG